MPRPKNPSSGYTLLEIILVIALIGMLAAVAFPAYRGFVESAKESQAIADIGTLQLQLYRWNLNTGSFPPTLAAAGLDGQLDPWGRPYLYVNIATATISEVRKDKNLRPINRDFDLYSKGRDGVSALPLTTASSRDDIVRANDGAFIGRGEDY